MAKLNRLGRGVFLTLTKDPDARSPLGWTYRASLRFNANDPGDGITLSGFSWHSITHALSKAAHFALKVLDNPVVRTMLPPGVGTAVQITEKLVNLADQGHLSAPVAHPATGEVKPLWQHFDNPVLQALAKKLAAASNGQIAGAMTGAPLCLIDVDGLERQHRRAMMGHHGYRGGWRRGRGRGGGGWGWGWGPYPYGYDTSDDAAPSSPPAPNYPSQPFYDPYRPSRGLPTYRPIGFRDAYRRIYGPQPGAFRFPRFPGA
jgi:hypothetical protein